MKLIKHSLSVFALFALLGTSAFGAMNYDKQFARWDKNGDGKVTEEEATSHMVMMTKKNAKKKGWDDAETANRVGKTMKRAAKQFAKYDADANGSLSKEELIALIEKK